MTTSGTTVYALTARDIVNAALGDELGVISVGDDADSATMDHGIRRLNSMLKSWQQQGALWKQQTIAVSGTADTATITLPAYVRGVNGCRYVDSATNERMMARWERDEYRTLPNPSASGTPSIYYLDRAATLTLYVWQVPTADFTLNVDIDRAMDTVTLASETVDIPEELAETVIANLAVRMMGRLRIQPGEVPELMNRADTLQRQMLDGYRPASYQMGPY